MRTAAGPWREALLLTRLLLLPPTLRPGIAANLGRGRDRLLGHGRLRQPGRKQGRRRRMLVQWQRFVQKAGVAPFVAPAVLALLPQFVLAPLLAALRCGRAGGCPRAPAVRACSLQLPSQLLHPPHKVLQPLLVLCRHWLRRRRGSPSAAPGVCGS